MEDMPWPDFVTTLFNLVDRFTADESEYYGCFNSLLITLFFPAEGFQVVPQFRLIPDSVDFRTILVVIKQKVPVFFVDVKNYLALNHAPSRKQADEQIRLMFLDFSDGFPLRKLYGISAPGTCFSVYEYHSDTRRLTPSRMGPDPDIVIDTAPQERWNYDLMTPEGEARFKQPVGETKEMAAALSENCTHYSFPLFSF
jgi:hypothetical protein